MLSAPSLHAASSSPGFGAPITQVASLSPGAGGPAILGASSKQVDSPSPGLSLLASQVTSPFPVVGSHLAGVTSVVLGHPAFPTPLAGVSGVGSDVSGQVPSMVVGFSVPGLAGDAPWCRWGFGGSWGSQAESLPFSVLPSGDLALPLGDHLLPTTREKILRGEFMDLFHLLYWEPVRKDKEEMDEHEKEILKKQKVERTWASGFQVTSSKLGSWPRRIQATVPLYYSISILCFLPALQV